MSFQLVLNSVQNSPKSPRLKQNKSQSPTKQFRKLKMELADRVFELKKQEQDFAQQKAHLIQAHSQERNHLTTQIKELYQKMADDNQCWEKKVDQVRQQKIDEIKKLNQQWEYKYNFQIKNQIKEILAHKFYNPLKEIFRETKEIQQFSRKIKNDLPKILKQLSQVWSSKIETLSLTFFEALISNELQIKKQEGNKINQIMKQKQNDELQLQEANKKLILMQSTLEMQKKKFQSTLFELKCKIQAERQSNSELRSFNEQYVIQNKELKSQLMNRVNFTTIEYEKKMRDLENEWNNKVYHLNQKWKQQVKKLHGLIQKIQLATNQKEKIREQRASTALSYLQSRQARQEDIKIIENLEIQLIKKQFQLQREKQGLKEAKLELDNMDDIYSRIFSSAAHHHHAHHNHHNHSSHHSHHSHSSGKNKNSGSFTSRKVKLPGIMNRSINPTKNTIQK